VRFGSGPGVNWDGFREAYLAPENIPSLSPDLAVDEGATSVTIDNYVYANKLIDWMSANGREGLRAVARENAASADLFDASGNLTRQPSYQEAYAAFIAQDERGRPVISRLRQELFLQEVYLAELIATDFTRPSRGYRAVETLFPARFGYTANQTGGAEARVLTGDLDLRLSTLQTARGGDIRLLGPGGRVLGGTIIRTDQIPERFAVTAVPPGFEGVLTLRGGSIYSFTDGDFLLNQSRSFTVNGGDVGIWSSNADINAGEGPKSISSFPATVIRCSIDGFCEEDQAAATTGAGIAAFLSDFDTVTNRQNLSDPALLRGPFVAPGFGNPGVRVLNDAPLGGLLGTRAPDGSPIIPGLSPLVAALIENNPSLDPVPDVTLRALRGTVDAGAAGVRVAGNLAVAALLVLNTEQFQVGGTATGLPTITVPNIGGLTQGSAAAGASQQEEGPRQEVREQPSIIIVEVLGYGGGEPNERPCPDGSARGLDGQCQSPNSGQTDRRAENTLEHSPIRIIGLGALSQEERSQLTPAERDRL
jgi:hypothetical protein